MADRELNSPSPWWVKRPWANAIVRGPFVLTIVGADAAVLLWGVAISPR